MHRKLESTARFSPLTDSSSGCSRQWPSRSPTVATAVQSAGDMHRASGDAFTPFMTVDAPHTSDRPRSMPRMARKPPGWRSGGGKGDIPLPLDGNAFTAVLGDLRDFQQAAGRADRCDFIADQTHPHGPRIKGAGCSFGLLQSLKAAIRSGVEAVRLAALASISRRPRRRLVCSKRSGDARSYGLLAPARFPRRICSRRGSTLRP